MYINNGIYDQVELDDKILGYINKKGVQNCTRGNLNQKTVESEDCLLLRHGDFERILIFNRDYDVDYVDDGDGGIVKSLVNSEKYIFQRVLNLIMLTCSYADIERIGQVAIYERV